MKVKFLSREFTSRHLHTYMHGMHMLHVGHNLAGVILAFFLEIAKSSTLARAQILPMQRFTQTDRQTDKTIMLLATQSDRQDRQDKHASHR